MMTTGKRDRQQSTATTNTEPTTAVKSESACGNFTSRQTTQSQNASPVLSVLDTAPVPNFPFKHTCTVRESHGRSVFGVAFNSSNRSSPSDPLLFATVAAHYVTIYQCNLKQISDETSSQHHDSSSWETLPVVLLQSFTDPAGDEEEFYCCAWSRDTSGNVASSWWTDCAETRQPRSAPHPHQAPTTYSSASLLPPHQQLVAAAGKRGVIRILCPSLASCPTSLVGHGSSVNELRFHPRDPALLFSFSKDYTVRLWNIASHVLVCVFGGAEGHRAEVLHGDLSLTGDLLLTAGMDHCVKIWRLNIPELANAVIDSFSYRSRSNPKPFPVLIQHFPEFSSRDIHGNYVDCARWFGALVISKSCENSVTLWKPGTLDEGTTTNANNSSILGPGATVTMCTEVGGLRLPSRLQPVSGQPINTTSTVHAMPGVPTEHKISIIHQLKAPDCNLWYIRFDVDLENQVLALGTGTGPSRIYLWDLAFPEIALNLPAQILHIPGLTGSGAGGIPIGHSAIRQTRFANDGKILICVGDNGLIVRFDKI
ncbi:Polycomb protein EED [Fasciola gigantica]|uniref:Polycomb protein EED n=1 Tax=Fasciola gigantica TaxID=46835 RepID=A0A504YK04_FASGI|nr:Polycomb protein EED [Fasciola gigantica]